MSGVLGPMFHGTRAGIKYGLVLPGVMGKAYATSDPEDAKFYGETKIASAAEVGQPVRVYKVEPVQPDEIQQQPGTKGSVHFVSNQGFMITGEHNG